MLALLHNNYAAAVSKEEKSHLPVRQCSVEDRVQVQNIAGFLAVMAMYTTLW